MVSSSRFSRVASLLFDVLCSVIALIVILGFLAYIALATAKDVTCRVVPAGEGYRVSYAVKFFWQKEFWTDRYDKEVCGNKKFFHHETP